MADAIVTLDRMIAKQEEIIQQATEHLGVLRKARAALLKHDTVIVDTDQLLTTDDAAKLLGIGRSTIHRYIAGKVPALKPPFPAPVNSIGRTYMFRRGDLEAWKAAIVLSK